MKTTRQAAVELGLKLRTVQAHIAAGNLKATWNEYARRFEIEEAELGRFKVEKQPAHRPRKKIPP